MGVAGDSKLNEKGAKDARNRERQSGVAEWRGFINVNLDASQKAQFDEWLHTDDPQAVLLDLVSKGCHVAIKLDGSAGTFMASITQRNPASVNAGLAVTARSSNPEKALWRAVFLIAVLGVDTDWNKGQPAADPDRW